MSENVFTPYQKIVIAIVALVQFTVIIDFMVLSPLSDMLMREFHITDPQFGMVVSAYAISAGISGLLAASFADRFDRKKILVFFYTGFVVGTFLCGIADSYKFLLFARAFTGVFGGVVGSVGYAIITDLFRPESRGRVMGFVQMAFGGSQILGLPISLFIAPRLGWYWPFLIVVGLALPILFLIITQLKPVDEHLKLKSEASGVRHLWNTLSQWQYFKAFAATILLATGGFMLMPFGTPYSIHNLGISMGDIWVLYLASGIISVSTGPFIGKLSDRVGRYAIFCAGSLLTSIMVIVYGNLGVISLFALMAVNSIMFIGIASRMISSSALMMAIPAPRDRGAFMSINSSTQYLAGGVATFIAGLIVHQETPDSRVENFDILCYTVVGATALTVAMLYFINKQVSQKLRAQTTQAPPVTQSEVVAEQA
jgi:predicted MFS family arabinose efflux permease